MGWIPLNRESKTLSVGSDPVYFEIADSTIQEVLGEFSLGEEGFKIGDAVCLYLDENHPSECSENFDRYTKILNALLGMPNLKK